MAYYSFWPLPTVAASPMHSRTHNLCKYQHRICCEIILISFQRYETLPFHFSLTLKPSIKFQSSMASSPYFLTLELLQWLLWRSWHSSDLKKGSRLFISHHSSVRCFSKVWTFLCCVVEVSLNSSKLWLDIGKIPHHLPFMHLTPVQLCPYSDSHWHYHSKGIVNFWNYIKHN